MAVVTRLARRRSADFRLFGSSPARRIGSEADQVRMTYSEPADPWPYRTWHSPQDQSPRGKAVPGAGSVIGTTTAAR
jgi:hypothetical protein